jgi:hypothetical protein
MEFTIDPGYLSSITVEEILNPYSNKTELTADEVIQALKHTSTIRSLSSKDHPEFTALRESLECQGYIYVQRGWWNGDVVLKPFILNGFKFKKGNRFLCASALGVAMKCAEDRGSKKLLLL